MFRTHIFFSLFIAILSLGNATAQTDIAWTYYPDYPDPGQITSMTAFTACAHAKFTGSVGVFIATSGPGAIHLLNGLYDAKKDHQPGRWKRRSAGTAPP